MKKSYLLIAALAIVCLGWYGSRLGRDNYVYDDAYLQAVEDAKICEAEEIEPLVELPDGETLLVSWHNFPNEFNPGAVYTATEKLQLWCVSYEELKEWFDLNGENVGDWTKRFEQLLGLPAGFGYTHFTAFTVKPEDVYRPAYQPDPQKQVLQKELDGSMLGEYQSWFEGNEEWSYETSAWPWTRLGYTYDWCEGAEKGLSEFIIKDGAQVQTEWTVKTSELVDMLEEGLMEPEEMAKD